MSEVIDISLLTYRAMVMNSPVVYVLAIVPCHTGLSTPIDKTVSRASIVDRDGKGEIMSESLTLLLFVWSGTGQRSVIQGCSEGG